MNMPEAKQTLRVLMAGFPRAKLDDDSVVAYASLLVDYDLDVAMLAAKVLIHHDDQFPSIARLRAALISEKRRADYDRPPAPELNGPKFDHRVVGKAGVAAARAAVIEARKRNPPVDLNTPLDDDCPAVAAS